MAFTVSKLFLARRFMSVSVNAKLVETLQKSPMAKQLGDINVVLQAAPELNNYPVELWQQTYDVLINQGFNLNNQKFAKIITENPKILRTPQKKLLASIEDWRELQFGEKNTIFLLEKFPELLHLQITKDVKIKVTTLKKYLGDTSKVHKALLNGPAVLTQSTPSLNEKIDFLSDVMRVEVADVYNSEALSCDILALKTRFNFLKRLGLYIVKKKKEANVINKNPKLSHITDTSDKRFATKVCHVTLEEYETFQALYARELENEMDDVSSDEEEEDGNENVQVSMDWEK